MLPDEGPQEGKFALCSREGCPGRWGAGGKCITPLHPTWSVERLLHCRHRLGPGAVHGQGGQGVCSCGACVLSRPEASVLS